MKAKQTQTGAVRLVQAGPDCGWIDAAYLQAPSANGPVIVANSAVMLGIPTVTFMLNNNWGGYYCGRPTDSASSPGPGR
jgi:uncharacterized protein YraI